MNTSSGSALFQKANDLANRSQWAEAREAFEAALAQQPTHAEGHNQLGFVYAQLGDGGKALAHAFPRFADDFIWWVEAAKAQKAKKKPPY